MKKYSTYLKETDPFSKDFDPNKALGNELGEPSTSSIDKFEKELLENEETVGLVEKLRELDTKNESKEVIESKSMIDRKHRNALKKQFEKAKYDELFKQKGLEYFDGVGFGLAQGGPYDCLRKWVKNQTRVTIKLQPSSPKMQPNRCIQAAIVAFDKHWNLLIRDADEVYLPANRLGHVQTYQKAIPSGFEYTKIAEKSNILSRYLKSSIIMGASIICIYDERNGGE